MLLVEYVRIGVFALRLERRMWHMLVGLLPLKFQVLLERELRFFLHLERRLLKRRLQRQSLLQQFGKQLLFLFAVGDLRWVHLRLHLIGRRMCCLKSNVWQPHNWGRRVQHDSKGWVALVYNGRVVMRQSLLGSGLALLRG